ncbi:hypothetical protein HK405_006919, partial [Cladochytrium tenue]
MLRIPATTVAVARGSTSSSSSASTTTATAVTSSTSATVPINIPGHHGSGSATDRSSSKKRGAPFSLSLTSAYSPVGVGGLSPIDIPRPPPPKSSAANSSRWLSPAVVAVTGVSPASAGWALLDRIPASPTASASALSVPPVPLALVPPGGGGSSLTASIAPAGPTARREMQIEREFCRDFLCCGAIHRDLHDLLRHIEEKHYAGHPPAADVSSEEAATAIADAATAAAIEVADTADAATSAAIAALTAGSLLPTLPKNVVDSLLEVLEGSPQATQTAGGAGAHLIGPENPKSAAGSASMVAAAAAALAGVSSLSGAARGSNVGISSQLRDVTRLLFSQGGKSSKLSALVADAGSADGDFSVDEAVDFATASAASMDLDLDDAATQINPYILLNNLTALAVPEANVDIHQDFDIAAVVDGPLPAVSLADIYRDANVPTSPADSASYPSLGSPNAWSGDSASEPNDRVGGPSKAAADASGASDRPASKSSRSRREKAGTESKAGQRQQKVDPAGIQSPGAERLIRATKKLRIGQQAASDASDSDSTKSTIARTPKAQRQQSKLSQVSNAEESGSDSLGRTSPPKVAKARSGQLESGTGLNGIASDLLTPAQLAAARARAANSIMDILTPAPIPSLLADASLALGQEQTAKQPKSGMSARKLTPGERAFQQAEAKISRARSRALAAASEVAAAAHAGLSLVDQVMMRLPKVSDGEPPRRLRLGWLAITDPTTVGLEIPAEAQLDATAAAGVVPEGAGGAPGAPGSIGAPALPAKAPVITSFVGEKKYICPCCHRYYRNANGLKYHLLHTHGDGAELLRLGLYFGAAGRAAAARAAVASAGRVAVTARGGVPLEQQTLAWANDFEAQEIAARKAAAAAAGYDEDAVDDDG